jgi:hypothetical protein
MACCGQNRSQISLKGQLVTPGNSVVAQSSPRFFFEYTGRTAMTVVGSRTGRIYRFGAPGARVEIDVQDVASLAGVPNVVRV